ncbi:M42 family metallopeptidase [Feifania hominis]|uniref:M20/M25/M40 family metallo-hydrolase n=1 Tax=Feifania hominis TaxID=2763660 RepID=A0A926HUL0_9FIRM|nr:M20/M25/M40 family metallo-hydrolase [Feifania hominis]MBC8535671.1 M20/M25/M40 family metallo-hydrolase [Feifania hominis]
MDCKEVLFELSACYGVSGRENEAGEYIREKLSFYLDEVTLDRSGNVVGFRRCGRENAKCLMLDAHLDEIGMMVTEITEDGFLHFENIAGVDSRILLANEVVVHGRERLYGIVSCKPPHMNTPEERKKTVQVADLVVDIGLPVERVRELVSVGDVISLRRTSVELRNGRVAGKSFDDRAGTAAILYCLDKLRETQLPFDLAVLISTQEETGMRGAKTGTYLIDPDEAIAIDVSHAYTPDAKKEETARLGEGPMVGIAPILDRAISKKLISLAEKEDIPYQVEVMGGSTGTNAYAIQISRSGVRTGLLSIPMTYMHTCIETIVLDDLKNTGELLCAYVRAKRKEWE